MKIEELRREFKTIVQYENVICKKENKERKIFQRLEFLGDKVLGLILSSMIFNKYEKFSEGKLSRITAHLCSGKILCEVASELRLDIYLKKNKIKFSNKGLADTLESIIGAYFIKNGFNKTVKIIDILWKKKISCVHKIKTDNKTALQEWSQSKKLGLPKYLLVKKSGLDHDPFFKIKVKVKKYNAEFGEGKNIQDAEQNAAKKFLNKLNI